MNSDFLNLSEYPEALKKVESVFNINNELPDNVFKTKYEYYLLANFDLYMDGDLVELARECGLSSSGGEVLVSVLDPDPIGYFYREFNKINWFYFDLATGDDYSELLWRDPGNPADAIAYNSHIITWIPDPANWAVWADRSREIIVIGLNDRGVVNYLMEKNGDWMDTETALNNFACLPYLDQEVPPDFRSALIANYGSRADLEKKLGKKVVYPWET